MYGEKEIFNHKLTRPPLYIKFEVPPKITFRQKMVDIGTSQERIINITNPSPNAWLEIKVLDAGSGAVIEKKGYNKDYSITTKQEFMVRNSGDYRREISDNEVTADIRCLIGTPDT